MITKCNEIISQQNDLILAQTIKKKKKSNKVVVNDHVCREWRKVTGTLTSHVWGNLISLHLGPIQTNNFRAFEEKYLDFKQLMLGHWPWPWEVYHRLHNNKS